jgi:hypothetical protein
MRKLLSVTEISNRKNELEQFKIIKSFAQPRSHWRAALCSQRRLSPLATSNFRYTWRGTHRTKRSGSSGGNDERASLSRK